MPTIAAGTSATFSIPAGQVATMSAGTGIAVLVFPTSSPFAITAKSVLGPYESTRIANVAATTAIDYTIAAPSTGTGPSALLGISAKPTVTTPAVAGMPISGTFGVVGTPTPTSAIQWQIDGVDVSGATSIPYNSQASDASKAVRFRVTATNSTGSVTAFSDAVTVASDGQVATLRQVASGTHTANYISTANKYIGVTSEHTMTDSVTSFKLVYANFRVATGEVDGAPMTASVGVEYPAGVFTRINFGGQAQGSFAAGAIVESDAIALSIPANAKFKVHAKLGWPTGFFLATSDMSYHSSTRFSAGAADADIADYSLGGGEWNVPAANTTSYVHTPIAIVAMSTKPCVALFGSSTPRGFGDLTITDYGITGYLSRAIAPTNAVMNLAVSGDSFTNSQNARTKRLFLLKYATHVVASIGTNDIYGTPAWNSTQVINAYTALVAAIGPSKKTWIGLYQPRNTGAWTSQGAQVINATFEGYRVAVNDAVKAGIAGATGYVDGLTASESNVNPENGLWRTDLGASTIDGIHMNSACAIRAAALVPVSAIVNS